MAIVVTSKGTNNVDGNALSVGSLTITAGSTIIVCVSHENSNLLTSIKYNDGSDDYGMTLAVQSDYSNHSDSRIYYLDNVSAASGSGAINVVFSEDVDAGITVYEVTGLETTGSFDKSAGATDRTTVITQI